MVKDGINQFVRAPPAGSDGFFNFGFGFFLFGISFQKIYDLYGLEHHTVEINGDVTMDEQTSEDRPLSQWTLSD